MLNAHTLVPLAFFAMPVAMLWIKRHYAALERGAITEDGKPMGEVLDKLKKRVKTLEAEREDLRARIENLESIACEGRLEAPARAALPSADFR